MLAASTHKLRIGNYYPNHRTSVAEPDYFHTDQDPDLMYFCQYLQNWYFFLITDIWQHSLLLISNTVQKLHGNELCMYILNLYILYVPKYVSRKKIRWCHGISIDGHVCWQHSTITVYRLPTKENKLPFAANKQRFAISALFAANKAVVVLRLFHFLFA